MISGANEHAAEVDITVEQAAGLRLVVVRGEIDVATAPELDDALAMSDEALDLLVDLSGAEFIDCTGAHPLARAAQAQRAAGRRFAIACAPLGEVPRLLGTLAVTGIELPVHHTRAAALRAALAAPIPTDDGVRAGP
jgi:anti-anti-sigma factor